MRNAMQQQQQQPNRKRTISGDDNENDSTVVHISFLEKFYCLFLYFIVCLFVSVYCKKWC